MKGIDKGWDKEANRSCGRMNQHDISLFSKGKLGHLFLSRQHTIRKDEA
jgi:hypothetical protein